MFLIKEYKKRTNLRI